VAIPASAPGVDLSRHENLARKMCVLNAFALASIIFDLSPQLPDDSGDPGRKCAVIIARLDHENVPLRSLALDKRFPGRALETMIATD
jgi:hypothetical protein